MEKQKSLKVNFIMNALLKMSSFIFPLFTFPYISRILLPAGTGKVSFASSIIAYFSMIAQLGIPTYGIRACAQVRDNREELTRTAHELLFINLVMSILSYAILGVALVTVRRLEDDRLLYVIISATILLTSIGMEWLYKALEQYTYITIRSIVFKFIALLAMFALIHEESDYVLYGAISIFASSASNVFNLINARKYIDFRNVGHYNIKRHLKAVMVFFALACAGTIYTNLDSVMLGFMKSDVDVGYYNAAVKIKTILVSIVTSLGAVLLPRASYYFEHGRIDEFKRISKKAINFVMIMAIPLTLYFIIYAEYGIMFLSGEAYSGSIMPMKVIMPTIVFIGLTNILGIQILVPMGKEKIVLYSEIVGAIVDVIINIILIPSMASVGAAIGTLVAECIVFVVQLMALRDVVWDMLVDIKYIKILLGLIGGTLCSVWIIQFSFGNFVTLAISASIFFSVYGLILLLLREELTVSIFEQLFGKFIKKVK